MVSVVHSVAAQNDLEQSILMLGIGITPEERAVVRLAIDYVGPIYSGRQLRSGEDVWSHALGMALILSGLKLDADCRLAAILFAVPSFDELGIVHREERFGSAVARLVKGFFNLRRLTPDLRHHHDDDESNAAEIRTQTEVLRKMLLAMVEDIRVVLLRLSSRTQTLRFFSKHVDDKRTILARETLDLYSPLANRLGVWELKWEMEDLSFRFLYPDLYKKIASQLDEKRVEREQFIKDAVVRLKQELEAVGVAHAEVYGRPKHIYSIWNKMRMKGLEFSEVYDVRALRIIVDEIKDCYAALSIVHNIWPSIPDTFDDYIASPKGNNYRSLHTAVRCPDGRALEVQIRTYEMHKHAELGIAAHWRYKEGGKSIADGSYDEKIAWLRQLLAWKSEVADSQDWLKQYKEASLDDTIYVMTPQGRVIDLPKGATPLDFAYRVHTDLGHRCRGAKVNGALVTLNTPLEMAQRIEIIAAKLGGPSRDWLNPALGYLVTHRARAKVRQWFSGLALEESIADGRAIVTKELQRMGETSLKLEELAARLGFAKSEELYVAVARAELSMRQLQTAIKGGEAEELEEKFTIDTPVSRHHASDKSDKGILIVGIDKLLTQLAGCCKPAPPDPIIGFVTRGKGVSIHRADCANFAHMKEKQPERVIETAWSSKDAGGIFAVDIVVDANDRQGLLRDISEVFTREKINVIAASTQSKQGLAYMRFTAEIAHLDQLKHTLLSIRQVPDVIGARRA